MESDLRGGADGAQGNELLDVVTRGGKLPSAKSKFFASWSGELKRLQDAVKAQGFGNYAGRKKMASSKLFSDDALDPDILLQSLNENGFDFFTVDDLFQAVEERLTSGRPMFGFKNNEAMQGVDYSIREKNAATQEKEYEAAVDAITAGTWDMSKPVAVGDTPEAWLLAGADPLPITMAPGMVRKVTQTEHDLPVAIVRNVAHEMSDPVFVFQSAMEPDGITVFLDSKHKGQNIMLAVHLNRREGRHEINKIASIYQRNNPGNLVQWMRDGLLRYINTQKSRVWFQSIGLQLPKEGTKRGSPKLRTEQDIVKPSSDLSISDRGARGERERVSAALSALDRKPGERLAIYQRAKGLFDRASERRFDLEEATGPEAKHARLIQSLGELDAILSVLPPEVRGKVGGYTVLANIGKDSQSGPRISPRMWGWPDGLL